MAHKFLEKGLMVAAVCGAAVAIANIGVLDDRKHTSNGLSEDTSTVLRNGGVGGNEIRKNS